MSEQLCVGFVRMSCCEGRYVCRCEALYGGRCEGIDEGLHYETTYNSNICSIGNIISVLRCFCFEGLCGGHYEGLYYICNIYIYIHIYIYMCVYDI